MNILLQDDEIDYGEEIALEAIRLERLFDYEIKHYTPVTQVSQGSWYSAALEDFALPAPANQSTAVQRLIEYIQKFIARIIENIRRLFSEKKAKENEKFIRGYKGPTDEDYVKVILTYIKDLEEHDTAVVERLKALPAPGQELTLIQVEERLEIATNKVVSEETKKDLYREKRIGAIVAKIGATNQKMINAIFTKEHTDAFKRATRITEKFTNQRISPQNSAQHLAFSNELVELSKTCTEVAHEEHGNSNLENYIMNDDRAISFRALDYIGVDATVLICSHYLKAFDNYIKDLKQATDEESIAQLKAAQTILSNLTVFIGVAARVNKAYDAMITAMNG